MNKLRSELSALLDNQNLRAFMMLIRKGEGTLGDNGYRTIVGGGLFESFADHPRQRIWIDRYKIHSTAAGAYQFLSRTWDECARALDLPDFSPRAQDVACVFLIRRRKALQAVLDGDISRAIDLCRLEWASLPGAPYGQRTLSHAAALAFYVAQGGAIRGTPPPAPTGEPPALATAEPSRAVANPPATAPPTAPATAPQPTPKEPRMLPLPLVLATSLLDVFGPILRDKLSKVLAKNDTSPEVAAQVAEALITKAKQVTGADDPVAAVAALRADPEQVQRLEAAFLDDFERMLPMAVKLMEMDEASVAAARQFATSEDWMVLTKAIRLKFIHILSLAFVSFAGWFVVHTWDTLTPELRGAVITLMVIAGWTGVRDFWMGSSDGSQQKTAELLRRTKE